MAFIKDKTDDEKRVILYNIIDLLENGNSLTEISKKYNTTRQSVEQFLIRNNYDISKTIRNNRCARTLLSLKDKSDIQSYEEKIKNKYIDYINRLKKKNIALKSRVQYLERKCEMIEKQ